ncbi:MAG: efflux RND transporter periplasmic adaptor subunit [Cupriavidus sp.]|nr:MAG: efflux RND transporter periplasmic adaptor subunit [Cupriavidus sp.]
MTICMPELETMKNRQKGVARTWGIAAAIIGILVIWMVSGLFGSGHKSDAEAKADTEKTQQRFKVSVRKQDAETVDREVLINGDTTPDQTVLIASQIEGQVIAIGARKGARVSQGMLLARIDPRDSEARMATAAAVLKQRELEYSGAKRLRETGYVSETELASRQAALEVARADVQQIELHLKNLSILAPVSGVLEQQNMEVGSYVKIGDPVAKLIKIDPLVVSGGVSENDIRNIKVGDKAEAEILGHQLKGHVKFVSSLADEKTRTFTVDIAVDNPRGEIPAGLSARIRLPVQSIQAQKIPSSLLTLSDNGDIGIKHVVDGKVVFTKAEIIRSNGDAVWITGLPAQIALITRGQGFVAAGESVDVQPEAAPAAAAK